MRILLCTRISSSLGLSAALRRGMTARAPELVPTPLLEFRAREGEPRVLLSKKRLEDKVSSMGRQVPDRESGARRIGPPLLLERARFQWRFIAGGLQGDHG